MIQAIDLRRSARPRHIATWSMLPTPIEYSLGAGGYNKALELVGPRKILCEMETAANLVDPSRVAVLNAIGAKVFPQIRLGDHHLRKEAWADEAATVASTFRPEIMNLAVEHTNTAGWMDLNGDAVRLAANRCRLAYRGVRIGVSVPYEYMRRNFRAREEIERMKSLGMDLIMVTSYPQLERLDPAGSYVPLTDTRGPVSLGYYGPVLDLCDPSFPLVLAEIGWHTRYASGLSDQAGFMSTIGGVAQDERCLHVNEYFAYDPNQIPWGAPGSENEYFHDMGLVSVVSDGMGGWVETLKPAAAIFSAYAAAA